MGTSYNKIYDAFLSRITDTERAELEDQVLEADMLKLLNSALPFFRVSRISLEKDDEEKAFKEELENDEIQIIGALMKREWYKRFIADTNVTMQKFADTDFEFKSQANHLKALVEGQTQTLDKEVKKMISLYNRIDSKGKIFDYSRFAGK